LLIWGQLQWEPHPRHAATPHRTKHFAPLSEPPHCTQQGSSCLSQRSAVTTWQLHLILFFYKAVRAYTVVLHVYEQFEIDYMGNKIFLSIIMIISKNTTSSFSKSWWFNTLERSLNFYAIPNTTSVASVCFAPNIVRIPWLYTILCAKETHF